MDITQYIKMLQQFEHELPTEEACISHLRDVIAEKGQLFCHHCGSKQVEHVQGPSKGNSNQRKVQCLECRKKTWYTSGTIFERTKKLKPFLAILWFQEHNLPLSSALASRLLGIAQSTAWGMIKKTQIVWLQMLPGVKHMVVLPSDVFAAAIRKRSRETPAREHPRAEIKSFSPGANGKVPVSLPVEEQTPQGQENGSEGYSAPFAGTLAADLPIEQQRILHALFEAEGALRIESLTELLGIPPGDLLVQITLLELDRLIESRSMGNYTLDRTRFGYLRTPSGAQNPGSAESVQNSVAAFVAFCEQYFHGTSRKYLQLYIAQFARATNQDRTGWDALLRDLIDRPAIHHSEIVSYVSPAELQMALEAA